MEKIPCGEGYEKVKQKQFKVPDMLTRTKNIKERWGISICWC